MRDKTIIFGLMLLALVYVVDHLVKKSTTNVDVVVNRGIVRSMYKLAWSEYDMMKIFVERSDWEGNRVVGYLVPKNTEVQVGDLVTVYLKPNGDAYIR